MSRFITESFDPSTLNISSDDIVINVGSTRTYTTINQAVASMDLAHTGRYFILVDPGTYDHMPVYLYQPEWSGRLYILSASYLNGGGKFTTNNFTSNAKVYYTGTQASSFFNTQPDVILNIIPDPNFNSQLPIGTQLAAQSAYMDLSTDSDFSEISYGFIADGGFVLYLAGFQLKGSFDDGNNVTPNILYAINGSTIITMDGSMSYNGGVNALVALLGSNIVSRRSLFQNIANFCIYSFYSSTVIASESVFIGPGQNASDIQSINLTSGLIPTNVESVTLQPSVCACHDNSISYIGYSYSTGFNRSIESAYNSYIYSMLSDHEYYGTARPVFYARACSHIQAYYSVFTSVGSIAVSAALSVIELNYSIVNSFIYGGVQAINNSSVAVFGISSITVNAANFSNIPVANYNTSQPDGSIIHY